MYGIVGPFTVPDLAIMYKYGDINDDTYLWQKEQVSFLLYFYQSPLTGLVVSLLL